MLSSGTAAEIAQDTLLNTNQGRPAEAPVPLRARSLLRIANSFPRHGSAPALNFSSAPRGAAGLLSPTARVCGQHAHSGALGMFSPQHRSL